MVNYKPAKLLESVRDGLVEQEHSGFIVKSSLDKCCMNVGDDADYPFYLRSCAKPLQATLLVDYDLITEYSMTDEEIAICCASHAGESEHVRVVEGFLSKAGISQDYLKCGLHKPLSKTEKQKMLLQNESENVLQNNCSGKHSMMLAVCKKMGFAFENYDDVNHPLQKAIKDKIYDLCELKCEYPITKDGCGVPIHSMPLKNMLKGYLNLFLNPKYEKIARAFVENPYLIGGEDRLDTAIMTAGKGLVAKVGAGGLCIVVNLKSKEALIVKIMDCDMNARAIVLIEALKQLAWLNEAGLNHPLIQAQNKRDILTLHGEKIGEVKHCFSI